MSIESLTEAKIGLLHDVLRRLPLDGRNDLRDDVERIVDIATQLFSAIERQTQEIEEELVIACGEQVRPYAQTVFTERLNHCAEGLNDSLQKIAVNLEQRACAARSTSALRASSSI